VPIASSEDKVTAEVIGDDVRNDIISTYVNNPWLNAIMCHVGSQGMALEKMVDGAVAISALADEIDEACKVNGEANRRITLIDIGGGLSANYLSEEVSPTFADYATMLAEKCPNIFNQERRLITGTYCRLIG
jgi:diaminopimelate decarboxylase